MNLLVIQAVLLLAGTAAAARPKHIIIALADDSGWYNFGWLNNQSTHTPALNQLVAEGINVTRHYTFQFCSPTRSALMSGRLPYHVNQLNNAEWCWSKAAVDTRMTMLPAKLKTAGYATHQIGKWHLGLANNTYTPHGRGFDSSLGYLAGSEHHFTQERGAVDIGASAVDLWDTTKPAYGKNGTYSTFTYTERAIELLSAHPADQGFFLYLAYQATHGPIEAPQRFIDLYPDDWVQERRVYDAMMSGIDESMGNITQALKDKGMWNDTLIVFASDNGGPALVGGASFANNYPLRGSKGDDFEGGVRTAAFVSGGLVPEHKRGSQLDAFIHVADWYATACDIAGVPAADPAQGVPGVDALSMWPLLSGTNSTPPRSEVPLHYTEAAKGIEAAYIEAPWKVVLGAQSGNGWWWGPQYPNSTTKVPMTAPGCPSGCLYNIIDDPSEHVDLKETEPAVFSRVMSKLMAMNSTRYQSDAGGHYDKTACADAMREAGRYWVPWQ